MAILESVIDPGDAPFIERAAAMRVLVDDLRTKLDAAAAGHVVEGALKDRR